MSLSKRFPFVHPLSNGAGCGTAEGRSIAFAASNGKYEFVTYSEQFRYLIVLIFFSTYFSICIYFAMLMTMTTTNINDEKSFLILIFFPHIVNPWNFLAMINEWALYIYIFVFCLLLATLEVIFHLLYVGWHIRKYVCWMEKNNNNHIKTYMRKIRNWKICICVNLYFLFSRFLPFFLTYFLFFNFHTLTHKWFMLNEKWCLYVVEFWN